MLGKLLKDEIRSYRMPVGITFLAGLIFTIFVKVICMLSYDKEIKDFIQSISFFTYYYAIMLVGVAISIFVVVRFYSTTVGDRGYLTWTLPVKTSTVIWSKLIAGILWKLIASVGTIILLILFIAGKYWTIGEGSLFFELSVNGERVDLLSAIFSFVKEAFRPEFVMPIILFMIAVVIYQIMPQLIIYFCISVGQLFGKWRIIASIGVYFLIMIAMQIFTVIGMCILMIDGSTMGSADLFADVSGQSIFNLILVVLILIGTILSIVFFALTNMIFKKHLNLE